MWAAWADWLAAHRSRWAILEGGGVPAAAAQLPGAQVEPVAEYALALPASFDAYLAARPRGSRRGLRQKLNRLPRLGGEVRAIEPQEYRSFMRRFVSLHGARAAHKGERHPAVDARLGELLLSLPADGNAPQLRLFALEAGGRTAGVSVRLDWGGIAYFYNAGFDPDAAAMSPGVVLELASIRDAIHRGLSRFDLGPGEYRYKRDLGGVRHEAGRLIATSPSLAGAAARAAYRARKRLR